MDTEQQAGEQHALHVVAAVIIAATIHQILTHLTPHPTTRPTHQQEAAEAHKAMVAVAAEA